MGGKVTGSRRVAASAPGFVTRPRRRKNGDRAVRIAACLAQTYPVLDIPLQHKNTFELLVAVILSAQCTDAAVNKVTPELFRRFPRPAALATARAADIEGIIRTLGLFRSKAKSLKQCARQLVELFGGTVPSSMDDLTQLAGVGRKTANVILGQAFQVPSIVVDTHVKRLSRRLGLTRQQDPRAIERDLGRLLPPCEWTGFANRLIVHGRRVCSARKPACARCVINTLCPAQKNFVQLP